MASCEARHLLIRREAHKNRTLATRICSPSFLTLSHRRASMHAGFLCQTHPSDYPINVRGPKNKSRTEVEALLDDVHDDPSTNKNSAGYDFRKSLGIRINETLLSEGIAELVRNLTMSQHPSPPPPPPPPPPIPPPPPPPVPAPFLRCVPGDPYHGLYFLKNQVFCSLLSVVPNVVCPSGRTHRIARDGTRACAPTVD